jgi:hypothetical protein
VAAITGSGQKNPMEADWEFEVGGGAPVIEACWSGFVDLRRHPECVGEIQEAVAFPPLAALLVALNGAHSRLWTAKCDLWEPNADDLAGLTSDCRTAAQVSALPRAALACYIDLLPLAGKVFAQPRQAEDFCRKWVIRLAPVSLPDCCVDLVIRQAFAGEMEGFGVTAYLSAVSRDRSAATEALTAALAAFADTIPDFNIPAMPASKLQ